MSTTLRELITSSLRLLNAVEAGQAPTADDMEVGRQALNVLIDSWSADRLAIYSVSPYYFPLTGGKKDYTLGVGGDWNIERPMNIEQATLTMNASLVLGLNGLYDLVSNGQTLDLPVSILNDAQYASMTVKSITSTFPIALYDNGNYPLRTISVWPIPTQTNVMTLWLWQPLANVEQLDATVSFPPGYERALKFNLALELAAEFGKELPGQIAMIAADSYGKIKRMNSPSQVIVGSPSIAAGPRAAQFNWVTGNFINW